jgi:hypothetical protein
MPAEQLQFPFPSLDFPGRTTITLTEMANRIGVSADHLLNEVEHGALTGCNFKGVHASRRNVLVPIETYRAYVVAHMTGPFRTDFVRDLPKAVLLQLQAEIRSALPHAT